MQENKVYLLTAPTQRDSTAHYEGPPGRSAKAASSTEQVGSQERVRTHGYFFIGFWVEHKKR